MRVTLDLELKTYLMLLWILRNGHSVIREFEDSYHEQKG